MISAGPETGKTTKNTIELACSIPKVQTCVHLCLSENKRIKYNYNKINKYLCVRDESNVCVRREERCVCQKMSGKV